MNQACTVYNAGNVLLKANLAQGLKSFEENNKMNKKRGVVTAWLFTKYDGRVFYINGIMAQLNAEQFPMTGIYLEKHSDIPNPLEDAGCRVIYLAPARATKMFNPRVLWKLVKFLRDNEVKILHCHRHKATFYGVLAACIAKVPVVFSHVHGLRRTRTVLRRIKNRLIHGRVNKVITVSDSVHDDVMASNPHLSAEKVITIRNSIDIGKFADVTITKQEARKILGLPQNAFVFGTVGRLVPTKGQSYLIDAFAKAYQINPTAHLVFIGDGRLENELKEQALHLGCLDAITFSGHRTDVPEVIRAFDGFLLPSLAEGLPASLLEAMAAYIPCIASAVGGIPEVIDSEKLGYLVPPKDSDALAQAMTEFSHKTDEERLSMGRAAHDHVEHFYSQHVFVEKLEELYKKELLMVESE